MSAKKRVVVVDDSAFVRGMLTQLINSDPRLEVVGAARDPIEADDLIVRLVPDVLTLDLDMPRMDGLTFLRQLMRRRSLPVVMISTFTASGAPAALDALALGAIDCMEKPRTGMGFTLVSYAQRLGDKLAAAACATVHRGDFCGRPASALTDNHANGYRIGSILALGASTGGTEAIRVILQSLPANCPPVLIVQHIPPAFSGCFARRLNSLCPMRVFEAEHGQPVKFGEAYVAPGHSHLQLAGGNRGWHLLLNQAPPVNRHRPSVEVMFDSVGAVAADRAAAALLTGMGSDGAAALGRLKGLGATTLAQDEASSVIWGMPGAAVRAGACEAVVPLEQIAPALLLAVTKGRTRALANG